VHLLFSRHGNHDAFYSFTASAFLTNIVDPVEIRSNGGKCAADRGADVVKGTMYDS
jgi:hypothetical protein